MDKEKYKMYSFSRGALRKLMLALRHELGDIERSLMPVEIKKMIF